MRDVSIIGVGMTPVGEHWDRSLRELALEAIRAALDDAGRSRVDALFVANAFGGETSRQEHLGALIADYAGLRGIEAARVEAEGASGGLAFRQAYLAVASGAVDFALVCGVEKMTDLVGSRRVGARSLALDGDYEGIQGATPAAMAGLLMRRYMHEYGVNLADFAGFSVNAHANGSRNPYAMYRNLLKPERFTRAPMVCDPVSLFDMAPDADGAAAVVLCSSDCAEDAVPRPIRIAGSAAATDALPLHDRADPLFLHAANLALGRAFEQANVEPNDVDVFELHDEFTVLSALQLEAGGFAGRGEGWKLAVNGKIGLEGELPISTFGGLKSRGHPVGATGVYQLVEAYRQLVGRPAGVAVDGAEKALVVDIGGVASNATAVLLSKT